MSGAGYRLPHVAFLILRYRRHVRYVAALGLYLALGVITRDVLAAEFERLPAAARHVDTREFYREQVQPGEHGLRLSAWLLQQRHNRSDRVDDAPDFDEGLVLGAIRFQPAQRALQSGLLSDLFDRGERVSALYQWLAARPVTGRVRLPYQDPRLLQARPADDPVLEVGDTIGLPVQPKQLVVMSAEHAPCFIDYEAHREVLDYVTRCLSARARAASDPEAASVVWLIQPDGSYTRIPLGAWASGAQSLPRPGAWLWYESHPPLEDVQGRWVVDRWNRWFQPQTVVDSRLPDDFGQRMAQFLATQGPAFPFMWPSEVSQPFSRAVQPAAMAGDWTSLSRLTLFPQRSRTGSPGQYRSRNLPVSASDFGTVGLLQTPTARMRPAGSVHYTMALVEPYRFYNFFMQPFDWFEGGFRYTKINNREFGPGTEERYTDKGIDAKIRLLKESAHAPELALGVRDIGGTGLFSGEYLVASKRYGDFDASLGLGWGYFGKRGDIRNPLGRLFPSFNEREGFATSFATTGQVSTSAFFRGPLALFGGLQYHTSWEPLVMKLEYDGNNYQAEPLGNVFRQDSRWNLGFNYRVSPIFEIRAGVERGNTVMVGFSLVGDLLGPATQKILDPPLESVKPRQERAESRAPDWNAAVADIRNQTEWAVRQIRRNGSELTVSLDNARGFYFEPKIERVAAVLDREAPADVQWMTLEYNDRQLGLAAQTIDRQAFVRERTEFVPPEERSPVSTHRIGEHTVNPASELLFTRERDVTRTTMSPYFQQTLGGPSGFLFYQAGLSLNTSLNISDSTWISSTLRYRVFDNYDNYEAAGKLGTLPEVRTLLKEYQTTSRFNISNLQLTHLEKLGDHHYVSVYGGYLEWMFAGVGAEYLYRPFGSPLAVGVDVNRVRQREFEQRFGFRDYQANTGHVTAYWDTGFEDLLVKFSVGQYLAGDRGFTLDLSRAFRNGVVMGAFFSRTNVTPEQFGEGSFDKGIYIGVPFDAMLPKSSSGYVMTGWRPLTRDGGAMLQRSQGLFGLTDKTGTRTLFHKAVGGLRD